MSIIDKLKEHFSDKYEIIKLLGKGGFAEVYLARDIRLQRDVAIKVLLSQYAGDEEINERFLREARLYAKLEHPHLIPVYDTGIMENHAYIIMKYIEGQSLKDLHASYGKLPADLMATVIGEMAGALGYIHSKGIIHRDIKPANILVEEKTKKLYLADFGIARSDKGETLTQSGLIIGTPSYISPEQIRGKKVDLRADIYAFGAMLYELASGKPIFSGDSSIEVLYQHVNEPPQPIAEKAPHLPKEIKYIISKCIEKKPENRFQNAAEVLDILENRKTAKISRYLRSLESGRGKSKKVFLFVILFLVLVSVSLFLVNNLFFKKGRETAAGEKKAAVRLTGTVKKEETPTPPPAKEEIDREEAAGKEKQVEKDKQDEIVKQKEKDKKEAAGKKEASSAKKPPVKVEPKKVEKKKTAVKKDRAKIEKPKPTEKPEKTPPQAVPIKIRFTSFPLGADVYWLDTKLGNTAQAFYKHLPPGKYTFRFEIEGYRSAEKVVSIDAQNDKVHQKFPAYGTISINCMPFAYVKIDGKDYGSTPLIALKIAAGPHTVELSKVGYKSIIETVEIKTSKHINFSKKKTNEGNK